MERFIPNELLALLEFWLSSCYSRVKWDNAWSDPFLLGFGVRQGSVLSPYLFAVYLYNLTSACSSLRAGLYIVLYADDILLIAPSVCGLENLLRICEAELVKIDMLVNRLVYV